MLWKKEVISILFPVHLPSFFILPILVDKSCIPSDHISGMVLFFNYLSVAQWVRSLDLSAHTSLSPIRRGFAPIFVNYKKGCTRLAATSDKVYQLLAQGRWFSPGTPASSTTKTGRHDIAEILLKVALNTKNSNSFNYLTDFSFFPLWKTLKVTGHHQNK
jgi:hypothetical protein